MPKDYDLPDLAALRIKDLPWGAPAAPNFGQSGRSDSWLVVFRPRISSKPGMGTWQLSYSAASIRDEELTVKDIQGHVLEELRPRMYEDFDARRLLLVCGGQRMEEDETALEAGLGSNHTILVHLTDVVDVGFDHSPHLHHLRFNEGSINSGEVTLGRVKDLLPTYFGSPLEINSLDQIWFRSKVQKTEGWMHGLDKSPLRQLGLTSSTVGVLEVAVLRQYGRKISNLLHYHRSKYLAEAEANSGPSERDKHTCREILRDYKIDFKNARADVQHRSPGESLLAHLLHELQRHLELRSDWPVPPPQVCFRCHQLKPSSEFAQKISQDCEHEQLRLCSFCRCQWITSHKLLGQDTVKCPACQKLLIEKDFTRHHPLNTPSTPWDFWASLIMDRDQAMEIVMGIQTMGQRGLFRR